MTCTCATCNPGSVGFRMFLCDLCGNKRCPKAKYHGHLCGNSNDIGQMGSDYGTECIDPQCPCSVHETPIERLLRTIFGREIPGA